MILGGRVGIDVKRWGWGEVGKSEYTLGLLLYVKGNVVQALIVVAPLSGEA